MLYRVKQRTGNDKIHAHNFRHTYAVEFLRRGGEKDTLQEHLGHSSPSMVRRYQGLLESGQHPHLSE
jgi:integrase